MHTRATFACLSLFAFGCRVMPPGSGTTDSAPDTSPGDDTGPGTDAGGPCGSAPEGASHTPVGTVVVLVTDGARIDESLGDATSSVFGEPTDRFWPGIRTELVPQGTLFLPGYTTGVAVTSEGHASIIAGARVPQSNFPNTTGPGVYRPELPTIFEELRQAGEPESVSALIGNTVHLGGHTWSLMPGYGQERGATYTFLTEEGSSAPLNGDKGVVDAVRDHLDANDDTRFIIANLHHMDRMGHNSTAQAYIEHVKAADEPIVAFWDWLQADPRYKDDTVLVVVADHGRHRYEAGYLDSDGDEDYSHHGDQCVGCRQLPMLMVGPGVRQGAVVTDPYNLEDLGHTVGWLLGIERPWAEGQIACEALETPPADNGRQGSLLPATTDSWQAWQEWGEEPGHKSRVVADGVVLSSAGAVQAEQPVAWTNGSRDVVCFRELTIDPTAALDLIDDWAWQGRCFTRQDGSDWEDLDFPDSEVSPYWVPSLGTDPEGGLLMAYADNHSGNWEGAYQQLRLLRWTAVRGWEGGWTDDIGVRDLLTLPMDPAVVAVGDRTFIAVGTSLPRAEEPETGRFNRGITFFEGGFDAEGLAEFALIGRMDTDRTDLDSPFARLERPVMSARAEGVDLAFAAYDADGAPLIARSRGTLAEGGIDWADPELVDTTGRVVGFVGPVFDEADALYYARLSAGGTVELCVQWTTGASPRCEDTGATAIRGLAASSGVATAGLRDAAGLWSLQDLTLVD